MIAAVSSNREKTTFETAEPETKRVSFVEVYPLYRANTSEQRQQKFQFLGQRELYRNHPAFKTEPKLVASRWIGLELLRLCVESKSYQFITCKNLEVNPSILSSQSR